MDSHVCVCVRCCVCVFVFGAVCVQGPMYPVGYALLRENSDYVEREDEFDKVDEEGVPIDCVWKPKPLPDLSMGPDTEDVDVGEVEDCIGVSTAVVDALPLIQVHTKRRRRRV